MRTTATFYRSDQAAIGVTIAGITIDNESWDILEDGDNEVDTLKVFPGGMASGLDLGGIPKPGDLTVGRLWSSILIPKYKEIYNEAGQAAVTVTYSVLERNKSTMGVVFTQNGTLGTVKKTNYKAGTAEEAFVMIKVGLNAQIV